MLKIVLAAGALLVAATAVLAQPIPVDDEVGGLWITSEGGTQNIAGAGGNYFLAHNLSNQPGRVPFATSTGYLNWAINFEYSPDSYFVWTQDGHLNLTIGCSLPQAGTSVLGEIRATMYVANRGFSTNANFDSTCTSEMQVSAPLQMQGLGLGPDDVLGLGIVVQIPSTSAVPDSFYIVSDDLNKPSGLFGPWTTKPIKEPIFVEHSYRFQAGQTRPADELFFWSTDADSAALEVEGSIISSQLRFIVYDITSEDTVTEITIDGGANSGEAKTFQRSSLLQAGPNTNWLIELDHCCSSEFDYTFALTPHDEKVPEIAVNQTYQPDGNGTESGSYGEEIPLTPGNDTTDQAGKDSPAIALPIAVTAMVALAARRRR